MKISVGFDHGALPLRVPILEALNEAGHTIIDHGTDSIDSVDYPDYGAKVAAGVSSGKFTRGILLCGSGIGMSMVANRFPGVRAALCNDLFSAIMCRKHNDANVLVLGGRVIGETLAIEIVKAWLETDFEGGRHQSRLDMFDKLEDMQG